MASPDASWLVVPDELVLVRVQVGSYHGSRIAGRVPELFNVTAFKGEADDVSGLAKREARNRHRPLHTGHHGEVSLSPLRENGFHARPKAQPINMK